MTSLKTKAKAETERIEARIAEESLQVIDSLIALAKGCKALRKGAKGSDEVYSIPPDRQACTYLIDRILGQPERSGGPAQSRSTPSLVVVLQQRLQEKMGLELESVSAGQRQLTSKLKHLARGGNGRYCKTDAQEGEDVE